MFRAPPRPSSGDNNCINSLWFYLEARGGGSIVSRGLAGRPDHLMQLWAPDDGRGGARNMLSDTKRQVINL